MSLAFWISKTWLSPRIPTNHCSTISAVVSYHVSNHSPENVFIGMRWYRYNLNRAVGGFVKRERYMMRLEYCLSGTLYMRYPLVLHTLSIQVAMESLTRAHFPDSHARLLSCKGIRHRYKRKELLKDFEHRWKVLDQPIGGKYSHAKGLFDHILGNWRAPCEVVDKRKGRSPSMNSKIVRVM